MPTVTIEGMAHLDGTYQLDLAFSHRDFRTVKQLTGLRSNEVMDALEAGDTDIFVAMASIALRRAGVDHNPDVLWDVPIGGLKLDFDEEEVEVVDDSPPVGDAETGSGGSESDSGASTNGATGSSPETETPLSSGTPQPVSTSGPET